MNSTSIGPFYSDRDCEYCTNDEDDDKIMVSVNPRKFTLPPPRDRRAKMEIKNKNRYPIYFRANTSNMDAFRTHPNTGCIPPNSKVSVTVQFFNSARPVKRHEEVVVFTSIRPFEPRTYSTEGLCPYCLEPMNLSKHYHSGKPVHSTQSTECFGDNSEFQYLENGRVPLQTMSESRGDLAMKDQISKRRYTTPENYSEKKRDFQNHYQVTDFLERASKDKADGKSHHTKRMWCTGEGQELEEICLHAFVHRPTRGGCDCSNCAELSLLPNGKTMIQTFQHDLKEQKLSDLVDLKETKQETSKEEQRSRKKVLKTEKDSDMSLEREEKNKQKEKSKENDMSHEKTEKIKKKEKSKDSDMSLEKKEKVKQKEKWKDNDMSHEKKERIKQKEKSKESDMSFEEKKDLIHRKAKQSIAHILARVKSEDSKDTSDTESSVLSSQDSKIPKKRKKFISEEDFMKKVERAKAKKLQKQLEEESSFTTTTNDIDSVVAHETEKLIKKSKIKKEKKWMLKAVDEKCTKLLQIATANLFLILVILIMMIVLSACIFITKSETGMNGMYHMPCFVQLFQ